MPSPIVVNVKVDSLSEENRFETFEANSLGLYNLSRLCEVFNDVKENTLGQDVISTVGAQNLFLKMFAEGNSETTFLLNGEYWGNTLAFHYILKANSSMYANAENLYNSKSIHTNGDYWEKLLYQSAIAYQENDSGEARRAYSINQVAALFLDYENTKDFVTAHEITINKIVKENGNNDGATEQVIFDRCWSIVATGIHEFVGELNSGYVNQDSFHPLYTARLKDIKSRLDGMFNNKYKLVQAPVEAPVKKAEVVEPASSIGKYVICIVAVVIAYFIFS